MSPYGGAGPEERLDAGAVRRLVDDARRMPVDDPRRTAASIAMFEHLADHWSLRGNERETLLGGVSKSTWSEWRQRPKQARVKADTRERIANLFTIDLNAHSVFAPEFADRWIREPNAAFEDESPISVMLSGRFESIITVRRYLERVRTSSSTDELRSPLRRLREAGISLMPEYAADPGRSERRTKLRLAVEKSEDLAHQDPERYEPQLLDALETYADWLMEAFDASAVPVLERAIDVLRRRAGADSTAAARLVRHLQTLGAIRQLRGERAAAQALFDEAATVQGGSPRT